MQELSWEGLPVRGWVCESPLGWPLALLQAFGKAGRGGLPFVGLLPVCGGWNVNIRTFETKLMRNPEVVMTWLWRDLTAT